MTLTPEGYRPRLIDDRLAKHIKAFGAVSLEGPKWCGKTWCAENICNSEFKLTEKTGPLKNRDLAESNPEVALRGEEPHLIDEWQEVPSLWDDVRNEVDKGGRKGRFILTGSSVPKRRTYIHSGTGRIAKLDMRTMTLFEMGDSTGSISLKDILSGKLDHMDCGEPSLDHIADLIVRGGWPSDIGLDPEYYGLTAKQYVKEAVEDACRLDDKDRNREKMRMLLKSLARNESTLASDSKVMEDMKTYEDSTITPPTLSEYCDCLDRIHLIEDTPCFRPNIRSEWRVGKTPKRHLTDVSLAVAAMEIGKEGIVSDLRTFGFLFESLCEHDLQLYSEYHECKFFHYRDGRNREIDAVIESPDGSWTAVEIKLGPGQIDSAAESLLKISGQFEKEGQAPKNLVVICGMTRYAYKRPDGVMVLPITALGP